MNNTNKITVINSHPNINNSTDIILKELFKNYSTDYIYLRDLDISYYDSENKNIDDDFISVAEKMSKSNIIIFATPVYWYTMSASMKTLFDRFTDLITIRKDLGRMLEGKKCYIVASGFAEETPEHFETPFKLTMEYFQMKYKGCFYYCSNNEKSEAFNTANDEHSKELLHSIESI